MNPLTVVEESQGFFTRVQAREAGYNDRGIAQEMRSGRWFRIRRGYYTSRARWHAATPEERHLIRAHAVLHALGPAVALSHVSGALQHGIATWGTSLDRVHVTRLDGGAGRVEGDVVHHEGLCLDGEIVEVDGHRVLSAVRCAIEASTGRGLKHPGETSLVHFDSFLFEGLGDWDDLQRQFRLMRSWPLVQHLHVPIRMADGRAQSPGESRGRWLFWSSGIPLPRLQYDVVDERGVVQGTCDWCWPEHKLLGEFDGFLKYGRLLKPGQQAGDVVFAEKQREDRLRELSGCAMVRLIWVDYDRPRLTAKRIQALLKRSS